MTAYETLPFGGLFILLPDAFDCTSNVIFLCELTLFWLWLLMTGVVVVVTLIGVASIFVLTFFIDGFVTTDVIAVVFTDDGCCWRIFSFPTPDCGERFAFVALFERGFAVIHRVNNEIDIQNFNFVCNGSPAALPLVMLLLVILSKLVTFNGKPVDAGRIIFAFRKPKRVLRYGAPDDSFLGATTVGVERPVVPRSSASKCSAANKYK